MSDSRLSKSGSQFRCKDYKWATEKYFPKFNQKSVIHKGTPNIQGIPQYSKDPQG